MIMKVRLEAMLKHKTKKSLMLKSKNNDSTANKYFKFLGKEQKKRF